MKKLKPKAYSMGCGGHQIIYRCGKEGCDFHFNLASSDWHFCPKCGTAINWGVVTQANEEWKQEFLSALEDKEKKEKLLTALDTLNSYIDDECQRQMKTTEATKKAITQSNINYYIGIGWTKEQLLDNGWFKEEDFND